MCLLILSGSTQPEAETYESAGHSSPFSTSPAGSHASTTSTFPDIPRAAPLQSESNATVQGIMKGKVAGKAKGKGKGKALATYPPSPI